MWVPSGRRRPSAVCREKLRGREWYASGRSHKRVKNPSEGDLPDACHDYSSAVIRDRLRRVDSASRQLLYLLL